jgi:hypothetical protein
MRRRGRHLGVAVAIARSVLAGQNGVPGMGLDHPLSRAAAHDVHRVLATLHAGAVEIMIIATDEPALRALGLQLKQGRSANREIVRLE